MLVDNVTLIIKAGNGGDGSNSVSRTMQHPNGKPDGGNGGNGGSVFVTGSQNLRDLSEFRFKKKIKAEDGIAGKEKDLDGKNAQDVIITVPFGTHITNKETLEEIEITDNSKILLVKGGKGGPGSGDLKHAIELYSQRQGEKGEQKELSLALKIIADIGLIGLPNAGKSSLLKVLTNAKPEIGDYPFTTLAPNIGMLKDLAIADIPGLIEGASKGKGLGIQFLQHIEKTKILVHCIDSTEENPTQAYETVRNEFKEYSKLLLEKPELILLTKADLADKNKLELGKKGFEKMGKKVLTCSIYQEDSIEKLKKILADLIK